MAKRAKRQQHWTVELPPNGKVTEEHTIACAYYWPMEGYGCATSFPTVEAAMEFARREAPDEDATGGRAVMHVIETTRRITVVRREKTP